VQLAGTGRLLEANDRFWLLDGFNFHFSENFFKPGQKTVPKNTKQHFKFSLFNK